MSSMLVPPEIFILEPFMMTLLVLAPECTMSSPSFSVALDSKPPEDTNIVPPELSVASAATAFSPRICTLPPESTSKPMAVSPSDTTKPAPAET